MKQKTKTFDFLLMLPPILLTGFGIVMVYSASMVTSVLEGEPAYSLMMKQVIWFILGLLFFLFACFFNYKFYQKMSFWIVIGLFFALIAVEFFGVVGAILNDILILLTLRISKRKGAF